MAWDWYEHEDKGCIDYDQELEPVWEGNRPVHNLIYYITDDTLKTNYIVQTSYPAWIVENEGKDNERLVYIPRSAELDKKAIDKRLKEHRKSDLNKELISENAKIDIIVYKYAVKGHQKVNRIEKYWTGKYKNTDGYKTINRLNVKEEQEVDKAAPPMHVDLKQLQLPGIRTTVRQLRWQAGKGLPEITVTRTKNGKFDSIEMDKKIQKWLKETGVTIPRIKAKMDALKR